MYDILCVVNISLIKLILLPSHLTRIYFNNLFVRIASEKYKILDINLNWKKG